MGKARRFGPRVLAPLTGLLGALAGSVGASAEAPNSAPVTGATPLAAFDQRTRAAALDARCALLSKGARDTLNTGQQHAAVVLARAGLSDAQIAQRREALFSEAAQASCDDPAVQAIGADVENAFAAWLRMQSMGFSGLHRRWTAMRAAYAGSPGWLARQDVLDEAAPERAWGVFGVVQDGPERRLALAAPASTGLKAARLVLRDHRRASAAATAQLARFERRPATESPLWAGAAPQALARSFWAAGRARLSYESDWRAAPRAGEDFILMWFPPDALAAFEHLSPAETAIIEAQTAGLRGAARPLRLAVEVGDFAAAMHFATFDLRHAQ